MTVTTSPTTSPVLSRLRNDVKQRKIVIFLGAGVSAALAEDREVDGFDLTSWGGLLQHGAMWAKEFTGKDKDFTDSIALDIRSGGIESMLAAADKVSRALKQHDEFGRWLRDSVGKLKYSNRAKDLAAHLKTFANEKIPLITTNYDGLLEEATGLDSITWKDSEKLHEQLADNTSNRPPKIIHLHGYYESPETVVLGMVDYVKFLEDKFLETLRAALAFTRSLVFVGFGQGFEDPHFSQFLSVVKTVIGKGGQRIYRLCRAQEQAELFKQNSGIPVVYGDDFKDLPGFLGKLFRDQDLPPLMPKCVLLAGRYDVKEHRERARVVADQHLRPACKAANYFVPLHVSDDEDLYDASMSDLLHAPMAVAYVGPKSWPSDILAKIGFRLATGKPLVLVFERGEEFNPPLFDSLQRAMKLREMRTISVAKVDATDKDLRATVNEQITEELQAQSTRYFGARPVHPMAVVQIDTNKDEEEYIDATKTAMGLLTEDGYLLGRRGRDIVNNLQPRIVPEQWPYFSREQDRLYRSFLEAPEPEKLDLITPIAHIPLVYKQPIKGGTRAILPVVTRHASKGGIHHMEVLHLDVTASMMRMADGHYELVSPRGVDEVTCAALAEDRWFYSPSPSLEIRDGLIVDTNLICRVLLGATDGSLHGRAVKFLLDKLSLEQDDLGLGNPKFDLDSMKPYIHSVEFSSDAYGKISGRGYTRPLVNLVSGRPVGMLWDWALKEIERDTEFRPTFRDHLTHALKWDVYAANYDRVLPLCEYYSDAVSRHVSYLASSQPDHRICDIGAGTGNLSLQLLERGYHVTAVDLSRSMLRHLAAKTTIGYSSRLRVLQQSAEKLPQLDSNAFDGVTIMMALYGMGQPERALDECIRILKPGGKLVITEPTADLSVEVIIKGAEASLKDKGLLQSLAEPWARVQEAGRWLEEKIRFRIEAIEDVLVRDSFNIQTKDASHFGQCATIVATKPR